MSKYQLELDKLTVPERAVEGLEQRLTAPKKRRNFRTAAVAVAACLALSITAVAGAAIVGGWNVKSLGLFDREVYIENVREYFPAYEPGEKHAESFAEKEGRYVVTATLEDNVKVLDEALYEEIYNIFAWAQENKPFRATDEEFDAMSEEEKDAAFRRATVNPVREAMVFQSADEANEKLGIHLLQSDLLTLQPDSQIEMNVFKLKTGMLTGEEMREEITNGFQIWLRGVYKYEGWENVTVQLRQEFTTVEGYPTSAEFTYEEAVEMTTVELENGIVAQYGADGKTANAFATRDGIACTVRIQSENGEALGKKVLEGIMLEVLNSLK